jgi:hypothetical protein
MNSEGGLLECSEENLYYGDSVREGSRCESKEPVARFLKSYDVFISDHTTKEDVFFDVIEDRKIISIEEDEMIKKEL